MRSKKVEVTRREIETASETRFNVTRGRVHHVPNQERTQCRLIPVNVNDVAVINGGGNCANAQRMQRERNHA